MQIVSDSSPAVVQHRSGQVLASLQAGRALAALAVVVHHANMSATDLVGGAPRFAPVLSHGALGVDFFFVLSGFIIYYSSVGYRTDASWTVSFLLRRAIRIYLPYWPVGVGVALLYTLLPSMGGGEHRFSWLSTFTLIPSDRLPALIPAWTLQHEVFFYALFAILIWIRQLWAALITWAAIMVALWWPGGPDGNVFLAAMNIEFILGIVAARLVLRDRVPVRLFALLGVFFAGSYFLVGSETHTLLFGLGVALLVAAIASREKAGLLLVPSWLVLLGNASYAIYLVHNPLLGLTSRLAIYARGDWWLALSAGTIASVIFGLAYYFIYEKPVLRLAQSYLRRRADRIRSGRVLGSRTAPVLDNEQVRSNSNDQLGRS